MTVEQFIKKLDLKLMAGQTGLGNQIDGCYVCDLLSWVMSHAKAGDAWITIHTHLNVIAVATLLDLSCVIIPENIEIDLDSIHKADEEGIPVLSSNLTSFELSNQIGRLGI